MKKVLFIDRDGTLVVEPPTDFQVDSLAKLEFVPGVFTNLSKIVSEFDYELVMVTNQDGLGTKTFPEEAFWPVQNKILQALKNEGINFKEVLIDKSFEHENLSTRKPSTGLISHYLKGDYDLKNSYVIGDRISDVQFAKNIGCRSIHIGSTGTTTADISVSSWSEVYSSLKVGSRNGIVTRKTSETNITVEVSLDGFGKSSIMTGLGFFDHMLDQVAKHANINLIIRAVGDLHVDEHHTIEDTAIALGEAFLEALGNKRGIERYGFLLPMDDCLAQVAIDFGGRSWLVWDADFSREKIGDMPTEMFMHFFKSFSDSAKCNLHISATGVNEHHKIEAIFKAFARSIRMAVRQSNINSIPSTKGIL